MFNALIKQMQVECCLKLGTIIGLNSLDLERQSGGGVVIEHDGSFHIAVGVEPQHSQPGAIIDGGELVELLAPARALYGINELHIDLNLMTGELLLIALPPAIMAFIALGGRKAIELKLLEYPPDSSSR
jgi:hypothetical protein